MGDIFKSGEAQSLLSQKHVVILGDSNFRSIYKDTITLLQDTKFLATSDAKNKGEHSCKGDALVEGGRKGRMHNGISYREKRLYKTIRFKVEYEFITRAYNTHVEGILKSMRERERKPDLLIINSALWDMTRYGANCVKEYKDNLRRLFDRLSSWIAPFGTLIVWAAAPPISGSPSGALLVPEVDFLKDSLRMDIICANAFAQKLADEHDLDFVDLHFFLRQQIHRRVKDGIHWDNTALRRVVNVLLTHVTEAWGAELPRRVDFRGDPIIRKSNKENDESDQKRAKGNPPPAQQKAGAVGSSSRSSVSSRPSAAPPKEPAPSSPAPRPFSWDFSKDDVGDVGFPPAKAIPTPTPPPPQVSPLMFGRDQLMRMNPFRGFAQSHSAAQRYHPYAAGQAQFNQFPYARRFPAPMHRTRSSYR